MSCPICGERAAPRPANRFAPFCSERCRWVDLGRWLGEAYRIPGPPAGDGAPGAGVRGEDEEGR
jgi:endogenous inhibitor of DNA gyrase (YacG/DUF329 family)